jgi:2-amino-4-hydroxy-6-hydroxymethyldihydropteridine diphosphokinase
MTTYIAAGSNLGDRRGHLRAALGALVREGLAPVRVSSLWATDPQDAPGTPEFLNLVLAVETRMSPDRVLRCLHRIELAAGRRRGARNAPRTLDLDLLLHGADRILSDRLQVPHPRMWERRFVLAPLAEIAPDLDHPASGERIRDLLRRLPDRPGARRIGVLPPLPANSYNPEPGST